jgi:adenylate cyclase
MSAMGAERSHAQTEEYWREFLEHPDTLMGVGRLLFRRLPRAPRCQLCAAPFAGPGSYAMRMIGKRPSDGNPNLCTSCQSVILKHLGGAEVDGAMLFADIRGSTAIAERITPTEFRAILDRFYTAASNAVFAHGGILDKFVGDELVAAFTPQFGSNYSERAIGSARALLHATGHADQQGPWVPVGAAVHSGRAWFGAVGHGDHTEIAFVGDAVNTTARLAALAEAGEILVSSSAAAEAGLEGARDERTVNLRGKTEPVRVVSLRVRPN